MSDLTGPSDALPVRIGGVSASTGLPDNFMDVDSVGRIVVKNEDGSGNPLTSSTIGSLQALDVNLAGLPNFQTSQVTVGTSAVQLTPSPLAVRSSICIKVTTSTNAQVVYIGNSASVSASNGFALFNGDSIEFDLTPNTAIWAIGTAAGQTVYILELGGA